MNHLASVAARAALAVSMLLAGLAGLLLVAAMEASSDLPVNLLPEVVIVRHVARSGECGPSREDAGTAYTARRAYEATADAASCES